MNDGLLYKYRSWGAPYHRDYLAKNQLYFSSPADMNDPFDFKIPPNFARLNTVEAMSEYFNDGITKFTELQIAQMGGREAMKRKLFQYFETELPKTQNDYETRYFPTIDQSFGVICLSQRWDSVLMWSHYSDNHRGFCLGIDKQQLLKSCQFGAQGVVQYDKFPDISPLEINNPESIIKQSFFKAPGWAYEEEFRLVKLEYPDELTHEMRIHAYPPECLKEVVLGMKISAEDKAEIQKVAEDRGIPVYQVERVPLSFSLRRRIISK